MNSKTRTQLNNVTRCQPYLSSPDSKERAGEEPKPPKKTMLHPQQRSATNHSSAGKKQHSAIRLLKAGRQHIQELERKKTLLRDREIEIKNKEKRKEIRGVEGASAMNFLGGKGYSNRRGKKRKGENESGCGCTSSN